MHEKQLFSQLLVKVNDQLSAIEGTGVKSAKETFELLSNFEQLGVKLQHLRHSTTNAQALAQWEDAYTSIWSRLAIRQAKLSLNAHKIRWITRYRLIWRMYSSLFAFTLSLFVISSLVGFNIGISDPDSAAILIPQEMLEQVLDKEAWFARLQDNPLMGGLTIAWNNIRVAINCFLLGALIGLGGLLLLCFNGLHLGALFGYCLSNDFFDALGRFVLAHGPLELSVIVCAAFASLVYGRAFYTRPFSDFPKHLHTGAAHAATIILGVTPWLILAAILEAFMSPFPDIPVYLRLFIGGSAACTFWLWTFWPSKELAQTRNEFRKV